jgi:transcriptional regulator with XRE-family HTH domain
MTTFADNARRLREKRGITAYSLAKETGLTQQGILNLEREGSDPKLSTLVKLARALGVKTWELLPDWTASAGEQPKSTRVDHDGRTAQPAGRKSKSTRLAHGGGEPAKSAGRKSGAKTTWTAEETEACPNQPMWITDTGVEAMLFVHACEKLLRGPESKEAKARLLVNLAKIVTILRREPVLPVAGRALNLVAELVKTVRDPIIPPERAGDWPGGNGPMYAVQKLRQFLCMSLEDMEDFMKEYDDEEAGDDEEETSKKGRRRARR